VTAGKGGGVRVINEIPQRLEENEPDTHACGESEQRLEHPGTKLPDVVHELHPAFRIAGPLRLQHADT